MFPVPAIATPVLYHTFLHHAVITAPTVPSTGDIEAHLKELYDLDISDSTISRITDKIMPLVKEWQERPLQEIYAVVYMDAIHYHVRSEGCIVKCAVYMPSESIWMGKRM